MYEKGDVVLKQLEQDTEEDDLTFMPRQSRPDAPGVLRHVMGRGMETIKIFRSVYDNLY